MGLEIVRKIVNGVWATVAEEEAAGGALTVTGDMGSVSDVATLNLTGSTVTESAPGVAEATASVPVNSLRVPLTDAQIKALPTTPVDLAPAPGAGKTLVLVGAFIVVDTSTNGYDNFHAACQMFITFEGEGVSSGQGLLGSAQVEALLSAFSRNSVVLSPYTNAAAEVVDPVPSFASIRPTLIDVGDMEDKALQLRVDNQGDGDFVDGDPANTGSVTTLYMVVDL